MGDGHDSGSSGSSGGGGGGADELQVGESTVRTLTKGISAALDELREIGTSTDVAQGSGFDEMVLKKMEAGDEELADAFEGFCEEWEWGVRGLLADADDVAQALGLAAGMTWEEDRYRAAALKSTVQAASPFSNPHAGEKDLQDKGYLDTAWGMSD